MVIDSVCVFRLLISIIYPKKAQNISVSFFDLHHKEGFFNVGRQSYSVVLKTHQYHGYVNDGLAWRQSFNAGQ